MKTTMMTRLALTTALLLSLNASAADYQSESYQQAYADFQAVSDETSGSAKKLTERWEDIVDQNPSDPVALVMLGSSQTLRGRDALMPWNKMKHTEAGLENMAQAIRLLTPEHQRQQFQGLPVDIQVKTMAAITFIQVPDFFGRHEDGYYLFLDVLSSDLFNALPAQAQTFAFYYGIQAARVVDQPKQAEQWIDQIKALQVDDAFTQAVLDEE